MPPSSHPDRLAGRILWGLLVGLALGVALRGLELIRPEAGPALEWVANQVLNPLGQIFLGLLFLVVVPLVFASLAYGVVQLGALHRLGPLAGRTFLLFALNMVVGCALGFALMNLVDPGKALDSASRSELLAQYKASADALAARELTLGALQVEALVQMFLPRNLLRSVVEFQLLPLIVFALLVGAAGTQLASGHRQRLQEALQVVSELMTWIVGLAMRLAPYAVAAMICSVVLKLGLGILKPLLLFVACTVGGMALHLFGTMSLWLRFFTRRSPRAFFHAVRTVLVTAFSTSSSNATLPTTIQVSEMNLGISPSTAGFVLPLGATMNMSGTALYEGCVVLFIAQVYGIELSWIQQGVLLLLSVISAVAVAGIPGGSLPLIAGLLTSFGLPAEGLALILGTDRILDMARTTLNVGADLVVACIVDEQVGPPAVQSGP